MINIIKYLGIAGFVICLVIMQTTNHGIRGLREYSQDFKMLDMQFRYNADTVYNSFHDLGEQGRKAYLNFWTLDFIFIVCFLIVQITISDSIAMNDVMRNFFIILSILRATFDVLENCILMYLINKFPVQHNFIANFCSYLTSSKFIVLFLWVLEIGVAIIYPFIRRQ